MAMQGGSQQLVEGSNGFEACLRTPHTRLSLMKESSTGLTIEISCYLLWTLSSILAVKITGNGLHTRYNHTVCRHVTIIPRGAMCQVLLAKYSWTKLMLTNIAMVPKNKPFKDPACTLVQA